MKILLDPVVAIRCGGAAVFAVVVFTASSPNSQGFVSLARWRSDADFHYLESSGIPSHRMMVGITAWQQQIPLPQDFTGGNAFRIPRKPVPADNPVSAKTALFSGAIAVAVNGVPIFNPIKNDGRTDTYTAGELDEFGGHCGRADDYHYHVAPLHLVDVVGAANPIGYALDGYPLYGLAEIDGTPVAGLDAFNGHTFKGSYHYHATRSYPYVNGGLHGAVQVQNDAITPQPLTTPVRPAGEPLPGAKITGFTSPGPNQYSLEYTVNAARRFIHYSLSADSYTLDFIDEFGNVTTRTYQRPAPWPNLFTVNSKGLATGYATRVRENQVTNEQFVQSQRGVAEALPIDLGPGGDSVYVILYGTNLGAQAAGSATVGGIRTTLAYAGPMSPFNGVAQYNVLIPRAVAGRGNVDVTVTVNNRASNTVYVNIK